HMFQLVLHLIEKLAFSNLKSRLIAQLVGYARVQNTNTLSVTHEALANDLGTSREVVTRLLKQLEDKNVVKLERKKILLLKKDFPSDA
ncbi:MAG: helix-turn-helix domain-containing protein, partial [Clostridia bacterium]